MVLIPQLALNRGLLAAALPSPEEVRTTDTTTRLDVSCGPDDERRVANRRQYDGAVGPRRMTWASRITRWLLFVPEALSVG